MLDIFRDWLKQPFQLEMDAVHWAAFVLFLIIVAALWGRVLSHMGEGF